MTSLNVLELDSSLNLRLQISEFRFQSSDMLGHPNACFCNSSNGCQEPVNLACIMNQDAQACTGASWFMLVQVTHLLKRGSHAARPAHLLKCVQVQVGWSKKAKNIKKILRQILEICQSVQTLKQVLVLKWLESEYVCKLTPSIPRFDSKLSGFRSGVPRFRSEVPRFKFGVPRSDKVWTNRILELRPMLKMWLSAEIRNFLNQVTVAMNLPCVACIYKPRCAGLHLRILVHTL